MPLKTLRVLFCAAPIERPYEPMPAYEIAVPPLLEPSSTPLT